MKNNHPKSCDLPFGGLKIKFPVSFDIKVIMDMVAGKEANEERLAGIFNLLEVKHTGWSDKYSSGGKFISFTVQITLETKEKMDALYLALQKEPSVRFAV